MEADSGQPCPYKTQPDYGTMTLATTDCASAPICGPYDMTVDNAQNMVAQLWAKAGQQCCSDGLGGCSNIVSANKQAADLCSKSNVPQCMDCGSMAFYVNNMVSSCQQGGNVGGSVNVKGVAGLSIEM